MFVTRTIRQGTKVQSTNAPETDTRYDIKTYESYDIDVVRRTSPAICRDRAPARPVASIHRRCAAREKRVRAPGDHAPPDRTAPRTRHPAGRTVSPQAARPRPIRAARACHECRESAELARSASGWPQGSGVRAPHFHRTENHRAQSHAPRYGEKEEALAAAPRAEQRRTRTSDDTARASPHTQTSHDNRPRRAHTDPRPQHAC